MDTSKDSSMGAGRTRREVKGFNELITCTLCGGYQINPVSLDNCSHSYCRVCIIKHLDIDSYCPQCKHNGGKQISYSNLRPDEALRRVVFKLVPGLYEKERDRIAQFKRASGLDDDAADVFEADDQIFSPREPISLSMEYHPAALKYFSADQIPPICYLQCQAGVKIYHLKRLMCSKFGIRPTDQRVELEVIYEDEVLPTDFTLMDVAYCYNWTRNAPMVFRYRVVWLNSKPQNSPSVAQAATQNTGTKTVEAATFKAPLNSIKKSNNDAKSLSFTISSVGPALPRADKALKAKQPAENSPEQVNNSTGKATPKSPESKKLSPPRPNQETQIITNNFKSLRSNDMRGSDYTFPATTLNTKPKTVEPPESVAPKSVMKISGTTLEVAPKVVVKKEIDFMVKIPKTEAPLADAGTEYYIAKSKKSPHAHEDNNNTKKCRDLPKLKIDLNNLTTKCALVKPKSADVHSEKSELKRLKYRKHSLDESEVLADKVDLATYAKNIGLKPIEIATPEHKYSPNASPRSSNSSSASSISAGNVFPASSEDLSSFSSHKKRKKKHSKSNGKRRKLHAEISSLPEEESLKMKVKITGSHIHTHKTHKSDSKRDAAGGTQKSPKCSSAEREDGMPIIKIKTKYASLPSTPVHDNGELPNLSKKLSKSTSNDIETTSVSKQRESRGPESSIAAQIALKLTTNPKELKTASSPTLPPSLFKATAFTPTPTTVADLKSTPTKVKPIAPKAEPILQTFKLHPPEAKIKTPPAKMPQPEFLVPGNPRQLFTAQRSPSTPSTIATALHKSATLLKRSASMDDDALAARMGAKQRRLEPLSAMRKTAYHPAMDSPHMLSVKYKQQNGKLTHAVRANPMDMVYCPSMTAPSSALLKKSKPTTCISISKVSDTFSKSSLNSGSSAVTITARPKSVAQLGYNAPDLSGKPAVEIVRINSHQIPADKKPLPALAVPNRVMGPPLTSAKVKKPAVQVKMSPGATVKSPPLNRNPPQFMQKPHNSYRTSPPALINFRNTVPLPFAAKSSADAVAKPTKASAAESQKASLRDFRPAFKEQSGDILDLSAEKAEKPSKSPKVTTLSAGSSLEDALNKIKQNISALDNSTAGKYESHAEATSDDLQNLHMLSESATAREKIAIQAPLNDKPKLPQTMVVRQQNASVRNIPNPSALAFRNQPSSISLPLSPTKSPGDGDKPPNAKSAAQPLPAATAAASANRPAKKHPTIDQVAANLNIRAAAAEASAVKSALSEEVAVSSTSLAEKPLSEKSIAETNKKAATADSINGSNKTVAATSSSGKSAENPVNAKTSEPSSEAKKTLSLTSSPKAVNTASTVST